MAIWYAGIAYWFTYCEPEYNNSISNMFKWIDLLTTLIYGGKDEEK